MTPLDLADWRALVGRELGVSSWHGLDQDRIDAFATLTEDHQFIHVDPVRARATPLGGTVAHGFLTLSMLSRLAEEVVPPVRGALMSFNYGFDRLRFLAPVPAGGRIRGRFGLKDLRDRAPGEILLVLDVVVELDGSAKAALAAEWLGLVLMERPVSPS